MDSNLQSPPPPPPPPPADANAETKAEFRKPSSQAANRKYRRHSPGNVSPDGSPPMRERSSSPIHVRGDAAREPERRERRKGDERELERDSGRTKYGKSGDYSRQSDRNSSRNSHGFSRHDAEERSYPGSSRSGRESRGVNHSDLIREDGEHGRSREHVRSVDKYSRDRYDSSGSRSKDKDLSPERAGSARRYSSLASEENDRERHRRDRDGRDEKRDYHRSYRDHRSDRSLYYEESRGHRNESYGRDNEGHRSREASKNDQKELNGQKEKRKHDDRETNRDKDRYNKQQNADKSVFESEPQESLGKKPKLFSSETDASQTKDAYERRSSSSMKTQELDDKATVGQAHGSNSEVANDMNAAKAAAMKAAELVNKNLVGGATYMSTDQKKKLLWGNKKSTTSEESGHRWDTALFGDRDRQEKFNKLMGVKGTMTVEQKPVNQDAEKQKELQMDLEKQYTAGLRRRDGRTVGLGL